MLFGIGDKADRARSDVHGQDWPKLDDEHLPPKAHFGRHTLLQGLGTAGRISKASSASWTRAPR